MFQYEKEASWNSAENGKRVLLGSGDRKNCKAEQTQGMRNHLTGTLDVREVMGGC